MNDRKNYNSIVFLTTLSVYLGLVLAGGAMPTVLAQAATTRGFDIKNETVIEDDLDKKPDDGIGEVAEEIQNVIGAGFISQPVLALLDNLQKLKEIDNYDVRRRFEIDFFFRGYENSCNLKADKSEGGGNVWLFSAREEPAYSVEHLVGNLASSTSYIDDESSKERVTKANVKFLSDNGELILQITSKQKSDVDAQKLAKFFNEAFAYRSTSGDLKNYERVNYHKTRAISENNQVFIVSRLPRGSIDALLADKNAQ